MLESWKGFSRFTKEAVEEGSNQELDSIKEGFLKSLNGDEDEEEKEWRTEYILLITILKWRVESKKRMETG